MSKIIRRPNRKGYYLQVVVPRDLRTLFKTSTIVRKLTDDRKESSKIKNQIELKIVNEFNEIRAKFNLYKVNNLKEFNTYKEYLLEKFNHQFFEPINELNEKAIVLSFWHCIGHEVDFSEFGSYQILKFFNLEVVVHNYRGQLWAFENSCPHRGSKLLDNSKCKSQVTCPYHGWTFTPNASYIPRKETFKQSNSEINVKPKLWNLKKIGGFIFISFRPLFTIPEQLGEEIIEIMSTIGQSILSNYSSQKILFNSNWKIAIENALEPYHISCVHKDTLAPLGLSGGDNKLYNWASIYRDSINQKKVKKSKKIFEKMLNIKFNFEGYWSLYLYPFCMISSTEATTFAHQFYQPNQNNQYTTCLTKLWCLESKNKEFDEPLNEFYKSVSKTNLKIFEEDAEICANVNFETWNKDPLIIGSNLEEKINHFRKCLRESHKLI